MKWPELLPFNSLIRIYIVWSEVLSPEIFIVNMVQVYIYGTDLTLNRFVVLYSYSTASSFRRNRF